MSAVSAVVPDVKEKLEALLVTNTIDAPDRSAAGAFAGTNITYGAES